MITYTCRLNKVFIKIPTWLINTTDACRMKDGYNSWNVVTFTAMVVFTHHPTRVECDTRLILMLCTQGRTYGPRAKISLFPRRRYSTEHSCSCAMRKVLLQDLNPREQLPSSLIRRTDNCIIKIENFKD